MSGASCVAVIVKRRINCVVGAVKDRVTIVIFTLVLVRFGWEEMREEVLVSVDKGRWLWSKGAGDSQCSQWFHFKIVVNYCKSIDTYMNEYMEREWGRGRDFVVFFGRIIELLGGFRGFEVFLFLPACLFSFSKCDTNIHAMTKKYS